MIVWVVMGTDTGSGQDFILEIFDDEDKANAYESTWPTEVVKWEVS